MTQLDAIKTRELCGPNTGLASVFAGCLTQKRSERTGMFRAINAKLNMMNV